VYIYITKNIGITRNTFNHIHGIIMAVPSGDIFYFAAVEHNQNTFIPRKFGFYNLSSSNLTVASDFIAKHSHLFWDPHDSASQSVR
jgi:hypothetical protein